ncbi:enhancer of split M2 protein-like [Rhagoletis pomonella]|uniref:enhancer of split M2 protein-like n=1 Tax=Rhagoletis pomonella TaxID=28610 RepID=UPI00177B0A19|nr:enhancer of split M2 protein-like [Rhagoletis pomonella]
MYTDTKNLAHQLADMSLTANASTTLPPTTAPAEKSKRKLCKLWRPLLRLMAARKRSNTTNGNCGNVSSLQHPNNVHLNNATTAAKAHTTAHTATTCPGEEWPTTLIEDYASLMRKMSCKEECNHGARETTATGTTSTTMQREWERPCQASAKFATTVISSASIEKTPPSTCAHCVYGRNCQHEQFHHHICDAAATQASTTTTTATATPAAANTVAGTVVAASHRLPAVTDAAALLSQHALAADLPIQFIHTEDGTFFWTNAQEKIDDDLLTAWLCQSWRQLPVPAAVL